MARLGALLLEETLISTEQLEEALETQVVHGGRLGTNLVELGFLEEAALARVLGRQHSLPYASGQMVPDPQALKVGPLQFYDDHDVLPMREDATRLTVAVLDPKPIEALDALAFKAGKRAVPVVIPEFRMNQLLRAHARAFRPIRPLDMNTLRPSKKAQEAVRTPAEDDVSELINEDDFARIYAEAALAAEDPVLEGELVDEGAPPPAAPPAEEPEVLTFAQAQAALAGVVGRDDIGRTVLRFARSKFARALLLSVRGDLVTGWLGMGATLSPRSVHRIGVSLREKNTFALVRDLRSHFVGPMKRTPGTEVFYGLLGGEFPATAVLLPLLVRGKPVHLLYIDQGPGQVTPPDVAELLILSQGVTRSYEALIRQRRG